MPGAGPWSALRIAPVATRALSRGPGNLLCPAGDILRDPRYRDVARRPQNWTTLSVLLRCLSRSHSSSRSHSHSRSHPRLRSGFVSITLHTPRPARRSSGVWGRCSYGSRIRSLAERVQDFKWYRGYVTGRPAISGNIELRVC